MKLDIGRGIAGEANDGIAKGGRDFHLISGGADGPGAEGGVIVLPWQTHPAVSHRPGTPIRPFVYSRDNPDEARQAKVLTKDEARRIAINIARLPELLGKADRE